jgi:hypothetical protein
MSEAVSKILLEIQNAGYIIEWATVRPGHIIGRARAGSICLSAVGVTDEQVATRLLAAVRKAPPPGSDAARRTAGAQTLSPAASWTPLSPRPTDRN